MSRVEVRFEGVSNGAVNAARQTRSALSEVGSQARKTEKDLGAAARGAVAGSGAFKGLGRSIAFASGGFLGGLGLTAAIGGAINELRESIRVSAQTSQALRSTGAVAGITAKGIDVLAQAIMRKTGIDDEAVKTSENLLLTFTQVRNEAGKGNDVFNQATRAVVDMSAVIGDLSSNSVQLGKALNDPVAGMTALRRVGVSFTAEQRAQIKALMEHGRILDAQKIILREVQREFGGQAAAQERATGGLNILRQSVRNLSADLLRSLIPSFRQGVAWLQKQVDWLQHTREGQQRVHATARQLKDVVLAIVSAVKDAIAVLQAVNKATGGWKNTLIILIGLKVASMVGGVTTAIWKLVAAEDVAVTRTTLLGKRLAALPTKIFISVVVVEEIIRKLTGDAWFQGSVASDSMTGKNPYPVGTVLHDLWEAGRSGKKVSTVTGLRGKTTEDLSKKERAAFASGRQAGKGASKQQSVVQTAEELGPGSGGVYVTGGTGPKGYDCSGYLYDIYKRNGIPIPRTSEGQWADPNAIHVPKGKEMPGDGVYFTGSPKYKPPGHCGIYVGGGKFIEYYQSGRPARVSVLANRSDYWGARRWIKIEQSGKGGTDKPAGSTFVPHDPSAVKTPSSSTGTSKGTSQATVISTRAGITETLLAVKKLSPAVQAELSPLAKSAEKHLEQLRASLRKGMSATDLAKTRAAIAHWRKVLVDEIDKAKKAAAKKAEEAAAAAATALDRKFRDVSTVVFRQFDRETEAHLKVMQKAFQKQLDAFDEQTQRGLAGLAAPEVTPEEGALASFRAGRAATQAAEQHQQLLKALSDAQASGDPEQILQAQRDLQNEQLDQQEVALQASAEASRKAADTQATDRQNAYQKTRDDQRAALQEQEDDLEQHYQQQRDDQRQHLQDDLDDWVAWITEKKKTWADFLKWLAGEGFSVPKGMLQPSDEVVAKKLFDVGILPPRSARPGQAVPFQHGGKVPGRYLGREDTVTGRLTPGETVIDRGLTQALERQLGSGGLGGGPRYGPIYVLGATEQQVARALERLVTPEQRRRTVYKNL